MASVLITGTSAGLGFATALTVARAGHTVYATMRNPARSPELAQTAAKARAADPHLHHGCGLGQLSESGDGSDLSRRETSGCAGE